MSLDLKEAAEGLKRRCSLFGKQMTLQSIDPSPKSTAYPKSTLFPALQSFQLSPTSTQRAAPEALLNPGAQSESKADFACDNKTKWVNRKQPPKLKALQKGRGGALYSRRQAPNTDI